MITPPNAMLYLIRRFEGCELSVYQCPAGVWTIGYGHTGKDITKNTKPISQQQAEEYLIADATEALESLFSLSPGLASESENKIAALGDFVFNLGSGNYKSSTLKKYADKKDWAGVAFQLRRWTKAAGRNLPGLVRRREAEIKLLQS